MPTAEEKYYDAMNTLLVPVRWAKSLVQTAFLILFLAGVGLIYPVIVYANHEPLTFAVFAVPLLVLLAIFTLFYATYYLIFGGMAFLVGWGASIVIFDAPTRHQALWIWFAFLVIGILQSYLRRKANASKEPPPPKPLPFVQQLNQVRHERKPQEYEALSRDDREAMTRLYGDNYFAWPESNYEYSAESETTATDADGLFNEKSLCETCNEAFGLLDLPLGASDEEVNSKKRAFAELLHDDRLGAMSDNARRIAKVQHQSVNEACGHILTCPVRAKLKGDIIGREPPPAPHQSTCGATIGEKTNHRPAPASSSGESEIETLERGHKVSTEQERIDALDATRRKVDETTNEIRDFLEQMKKQKQTSLERL